MVRQLSKRVSGPLVFSCLLGGALVAGCGGKNDSSGQDAPDITGKYNVIPSGTSGCSGVQDWITGWANGALTVDGDPDLLTFDFGEGISFGGSVNASYTFAFSGAPTYNNATLTTYGSGSVEASTSASGGAQWVLSGDLSVEVNDDEFQDNNCTITGAFDATELIGA